MYLLVEYRYFLCLTKEVPYLLHIVIEFNYDLTFVHNLATISRILRAKVGKKCVISNTKKKN